MLNFELLKSFQEVSIESHVRKIIQQIRELTTSEALKLGDPLP